MRALVTGGAGFIGHHLVSRLLASGHEVSVIDDFSSGQRSRLMGFPDRLSLVEGTILDRRALDEAVAGCELIYHEAAVASVAQSLAEPALTNAVNVSGTIEVMLAAARHRVRRVVFAGSAAVYGAPRSLPCRETDPLSPRSPYGASKLAAEHYVHILGELHGVTTVVLRYFNVFGPGQDPTSDYSGVISRFASAVLDGEAPIVNGTGEFSRDFVYVDNVIGANLLAAQAFCEGPVTCNIATGSSHTILDLLRVISEAANRPASPVFGPPRAGDIPHSRADISKAESILGYRVAIPFEEGIARTLAWYRDSTTSLGGHDAKDSQDHPRGGDRGATR